MGIGAEVLIDGQACELCGEFFKTANGFPCVCEGCWEQLDECERDMHQRAIHSTI